MLVNELHKQAIKKEADDLLRRQYLRDGANVSSDFP